MESTDPAELERRAASGDVEARLSLAYHHSGIGQADTAARWMTEAADTGFPHARIQRAVWRLHGFNLARDEAAGFAELSELGSREDTPTAAGLVALLHALGMGTKRDWRAAVTALSALAARRDAPALAQLGLLMSDASPGHPAVGMLLREAAALGHAPAVHLAPMAESGETPPTVEAAISDAGAAVREHDPEAWQVPERRLFLEKPRVEVIPDAAPDLWRRYVMALTEPGLSRALVNDARSGSMIIDPMRDNMSTDIELWNLDLVVFAMMSRIAIATRSPLVRQEMPSILRYQTGQRYEAHYDYVSPDVPEFRSELASRGQRTKTALIYLNDGYEGGETAFPYARSAYKAKAGDMLILRNTRAGDKPDPMSLHTGMPPARGEKWVLSTRIRNKRQIGHIWPASVV
jgi:prolyl 4-hydroxylase